jgi:hypothetical protein
MTEQGNPTISGRTNRIVRHLASFWMIALAIRWVMSRQIYLEGGWQHPKKMESENQKSNHGFHSNLRSVVGHREVTALVSVLGVTRILQTACCKSKCKSVEVQFRVGTKKITKTRQPLPYAREGRLHALRSSAKRTVGSPDDLDRVNKYRSILLYRF